MRTRDPVQISFGGNLLRTHSKDMIRAQKTDKWSRDSVQAKTCLIPMMT